MTTDTRRYCGKNSTSFFSEVFYVLKLISALFLVFTQSICLGEDIYVKSADLKAASDGYYLSASFGVELTDTLEDALSKGVALYFILEFKLLTPRWYTLNLWNVPVVSYSQSYRLSFNSLTRQYRLSYGGLHQSFELLEDVLAVLGKVGRPKVIDNSHLKEGRSYEAKLRLRLDKTRLPKPFQIKAIGSSDWSISSDWHFLRLPK